MLRSHRPLLLNWFRAKRAISGAAVEGFNNKAKLTLRKSYGFRSFRAMELALYHSLGALPEPQVNHGRNARYRAPPAQIPAGAIRAPGSHLG
jgi:transposase